MQGEYLSIETAQKLAKAEKLEKNWNELKEILDNTLYKLNGLLDKDLLEKQMFIDYGYIKNKMKQLEGKK